MEEYKLKSKIKDLKLIQKMTYSRLPIWVRLWQIRVLVSFLRLFQGSYRLDLSLSSILGQLLFFQVLALLEYSRTSGLYLSSIFVIRLCWPRVFTPFTTREYSFLFSNYALFHVIEFLDWVAFVFWFLSEILDSLILPGETDAWKFTWSFLSVKVSWENTEP